MGTAALRPEERPLDGELRMAGRIGAIGGGLGAVSGAITWAIAPEIAGDPVVAALGIAISSAIAIACLLLPWERLSQRWVLLPIVGGILLTVLASANSLGTESPYSAFFVFLAAMAGYFCTRQQALGVLALIVAPPSPRRRNPSGLTRRLRRPRGARRGPRAAA